MFTQPCFIRKDTQELRDKLKEIGLEPHPCIMPKACDFLFVNRGFYSRNEIGYQEEVERAIDCGTNEELFLALAALQDDSDENQWFVYPKENHWFKCYDNNIEEVRNEPSTRMSCQAAWFYESHKATVEELIEHFKIGD